MVEFPSFQENPPIQILYELFQLKYWKLIQFLKNALEDQRNRAAGWSPTSRTPVCNLWSRLKPPPPPGRDGAGTGPRGPQVPALCLSPLQPADTGSPHCLSFPLPVDSGLISFSCLFPVGRPKVLKDFLE